MTNFEEKIRDLCSRLAETLIAKNSDYGDAAFCAPYLVPNLGTMTSVNVRLSDKFSRLRSLVGNTLKLTSEPAKDTYFDTAGYALIAVLLLEEEERNIKSGEELIQSE